MANQQMLGLINLQDSRVLPDLNETRPLATMPIGGKYRLIDFTLSNMVNAGINNVGLLLSHQSRSMLDHIRSGKEWGLAHKGDGVFYLPLDVQDILNPPTGDITTFYKNLRFVQRGLSPYILISNATMVENIDFDRVLHFHRRNNADVTLVYSEMKNPSSRDGFVLTTDDKDRITGITLQNGLQVGDKYYHRQMLIDTNIYQHAVRRAFARGYNSFMTDVIIKNVDRLRVFGYNFTGYARTIDSLGSYYRANMDLLKLDVWRDLFFQDQRHIYTKIKDEAPAKYMEESLVKNSIIANGCVIEGHVENSIIFRKVRIGKNAVVRNSIIMQHSVIGDDACLDNVICDKDTIIQPDAVLSGTADAPLCIRKCSVL